jgi:hypothetical protein
MAAALNDSSDNTQNPPPDSPISPPASQQLLILPLLLTQAEVQGAQDVLMAKLGADQGIMRNLKVQCGSVGWLIGLLGV